MSVEETRTRIVGRVWRAVGQAGLDAVNVPQQQMEHFVNVVADEMMLELNSVLDASVPEDSTAAGGDQSMLASDEKLLWEGRPFLALNTRYVVTSERVRIISGLLAKDREDIELIRVRDVDHHQGVSERVLNIGDIYLHTADVSKPDVTLYNVTDPIAVHELIRRAVLEARKRYPFHFQQQM
jgi:hypothetical protein